MPACVMCGDGAVGRFSVPRGCVCRPDDREQDLCLHHAMRARPLGGMTLIGDYTVDRQFTAWLVAEHPGRFD